MTKNFYISYCNTMSKDETAIVVCDEKTNKSQQFFILAGYHKDKLDKFETLEECLQYFKDNFDKVTWNSEHGSLFEMDKSGNAEYVKGGYLQELFNIYPSNKE